MFRSQEGLQAGRKGKMEYEDHVWLLLSKEDKS
jgi:hypothetical protein